MFLWEYHLINNCCPSCGLYKHDNWDETSLSILAKDEILYFFVQVSYNHEVVGKLKWMKSKDKVPMLCSGFKLTKFPLLQHPIDHNPQMETKWLNLKIEFDRSNIISKQTKKVFFQLNKTIYVNR